MAAKTVPWARLGLARIHFAEGDIAKARHKVEALLGDEPNNADAYDVLGRVQMEQGQVDEARATFETVTKLTPDCILRLQHTGTLSFYAGDGERAAELLERAWTLGKKSRLFDFLSMLLLAFIRHDEKETGALQLAMDNLSQAVARHPQSVRLRRFERIGIVLWDMTNGRNQRAFQIAREISSDFAKTTFDVEAAMSVLSMLSRLVRVGFPMDEFESIVRRLGQRFSVSKSANQVLLTAAQHRTDVQQWLADALVETSKIAQSGVDLSLQAELERAVEMLLQYGGLTYNARVIELAGQLLKRHGDKIPNLDQLVDTQGVLARRFCVPSTHIAGVRRSGRSSGGLLLRE